MLTHACTIVYRYGELNLASHCLMLDILEMHPKPKKDGFQLKMLGAS